MSDLVLGLGLALPLAAASGISVTTGVAQGVTEQQKQNADASNQIRMLNPRRYVWLEPRGQDGQPQSANHPFSGFYLAYPDSERPVTKGLVSTVSLDPPVLNWIYIDKDTLEAKYASRSGSIAHHVGNFDWTSNLGVDSRIMFQGFEGFTAIREGQGWTLYFDLNDDVLARRCHGRRTCEVSLVRRVVPAQGVNNWGLEGDGNIGFRTTREVDRLSELREAALAGQGEN